MTIQLKPEQEEVVGQAIRAGLIANADDIIDVGVDVIRQRLKSRQIESDTLALSAGEWEHEFDTWIESFPDTAAIPDEALSRENLYPDRL
jgi:hypothetical protein